MNSALFTAQEASTLIPEDEGLQELLERLSEDLTRKVLKQPARRSSHGSGQVGSGHRCQWVHR